MDKQFFENTNDSSSILITKKITENFLRNESLRKVFGAKDLWLLGIGIYISGLFYGWNLSLKTANPSSILLTFMLVGFLYLIFILILSDLTSILPYAGGPYAYARFALGKFSGYMAGVLSLIQFIFFTALILVYIKKYLFTMFFYDLKIATYITFFIFILLVICHFFSVKFVKTINFLAAGFAISIVTLFLIGVSSSNVAINVLPQIWSPSSIYLKEILKSLPFIFWIYMGMEAISVAGEETKRSEKNLPIALITGFIFIIIVNFFILYFSFKTYDWALLKKEENPLYKVIAFAQPNDKVLLTTFYTLSISAFLTSLYGLIYSYSRQSYALSRAGYLPKFLSKLHSKYKTPYISLLIPGIISFGIAFFLSENILLGVAVILIIIIQIIVTVSYLKIKNIKTEIIDLQNKLLKPVFLKLVLILQSISLISLIYYCYISAAVILILLLGSFIYYYFWAQHNIYLEAPEESEAVYLENKKRVEYR